MIPSTENFVEICQCNVTLGVNKRASDSAVSTWNITLIFKALFHMVKYDVKLYKTDNLLSNMN
jgi:hypothetical protein